MVGGEWEGVSGVGKEDEPGVLDDLAHRAGLVYGAGGMAHGWWVGGWRRKLKD